MQEDEQRTPTSIACGNDQDLVQVAADERTVHRESAHRRATRALVTAAPIAQGDPARSGCEHDQPKGYPPPHAPETSAPAAYRTPASVGASSDTSVRARPTIENPRDARLVRRDQTETTRAAIVASAHAATIAPLSNPQWCAQRNDAKSSAAEVSPRTTAVLPRARGCSLPMSCLTAVPSIARSTTSDGPMKLPLPIAEPSCLLVQTGAMDARWAINGIFVRRPCRSV